MCWTVVKYLVSTHISLKMKVVTILLLTALASSSYASEQIPKGHVTRNKLNGRLEFIEKKLSAADLDTGTPLTEEVKNHIKKLSAPDDVIAAIVGEKIGGPGNETYNAVPMNPLAGEIWKTKVIDVTYNYLKEHNSEEVLFMLIPFYESMSTTRPYGFAVFVVKLTRSNAQIVKAYIPNPPKSVSETISPYVYSTGNLFTVDRKNETFQIVGVGFGQSPVERVEGASKSVRLSDLTTGTDLDEFSKKHTKSLAGDEPYVPGLLLSQKLGGKGDDPYNVVPMNPKALEAFKTRVEVPTLEFFKDPANQHSGVGIIVIVMYADYASTRPVGFFVLCKLSPTYSVYIPNQ